MLPIRRGGVVDDRIARRRPRRQSRVARVPARTALATGCAAGRVAAEILQRPVLRPAAATLPTIARPGPPQLVGAPIRCRSSPSWPPAGLGFARSAARRRADARRRHDQHGRRPANRRPDAITGGTQRRRGRPPRGRRIDDEVTLRRGLRGDALVRQRRVEREAGPNRGVRLDLDRDAATGAPRRAAPRWRARRARRRPVVSATRSARPTRRCRWARAHTLRRPQASQAGRARSAKPPGMSSALGPVLTSAVDGSRARPPSRS